MEIIDKLTPHLGGDTQACIYYAPNCSILTANLTWGACCSCIHGGFPICPYFSFSQLDHQVYNGITLTTTTTTTTQKGTTDMNDKKFDNLTFHADLCQDLHDLYRRKNADYGDSFHETFLEEGFAMARIRLTDKLNRFKTLSKQTDDAKVKDESMRDTLIDLANYALMTIIELERSDT